MNCRTGEIADDPVKIRKWIEAGDPVVYLATEPADPEADLPGVALPPGTRFPSGIITPEVIIPKTGETLETLGGEVVDAASQREAKLARRANREALRILAGPRR